MQRLMASTWIMATTLWTIAATAAASSAAEVARALAHSAKWGYLTSVAETKTPTAAVLSFSDGSANASTGRLFFCVMTEHGEHGGHVVARAGDTQQHGDHGRVLGEFEDSGYTASLTLSQTPLSTACPHLDSTQSVVFHSDHGNALDPEDPRCTKLTITGIMKATHGADFALGKAALFARHPGMAKWPAGHRYAVHELQISTIWLVHSHGGGAAVATEDYFQAQPLADGEVLVREPTASAPQHSDAAPPSTALLCPSCLVHCGCVCEPPPATRRARACWHA